MGWRTKFVFLLMVYFAGFATAIYCLAPSSGQSPGQPQQIARIRSAIKSDDLATSLNSGMHKCIGFSREAAIEAAKLIRQKMEEMQRESSDRR